MAYTPINWKTGDTITADGLNAMDNGWGVQLVELFSETVTAVKTSEQAPSAMAPLRYFGRIDADEITVAFDGDEYAVQAVAVPGEDGTFYGDLDEDGTPVFTRLPFVIGSIKNVGNILATPSAGEHSVAVKTMGIATSKDFEGAVKRVADPGWSYQDEELLHETVTTEMDDGYIMAVFDDSERLLNYHPDSAVVSFNGTEYKCKGFTVPRSGAFIYGDVSDIRPSFVTYPFTIMIIGGEVKLYTQSEGTYEVSVVERTVVTSDGFKDAVRNAVTSTMRCIHGETTYDEMYEAASQGRLMYFYRGKTAHIVTYFIEDSSPTAVNALPPGTENVETYGFDENMVFKIFVY